MQDKTERESIVERAKKFLAMTENNAASENEKLVASSKLSKLLLEYNLQMFELRVEESPYTNQTFSLGTAYKWRRTLAYVLAKYNFCEDCYYGSTKFMLVGRKDNVEWVMWLHKHIRQQIESMANTYMAKVTIEKSDTWVKAYGTGLRNSFCDGCVAMVKERLQQERDALLANDTKSMALISLENTALRERLLELVPDLRQTRQKRQKYWSSAYNAGKESGRVISMRRELQ